MTVEILKVKGLEEVDSNNEITSITKGYLGVKTSQNPYVLLTKNLDNIFSTLCPVKTPIEDYSTNAIPSIVLNEIALCQEKKLFSTYHIWYDDVTPDPVCIATKESWRIDEKISGKTIEEYGVFLTQDETINKIIELGKTNTHKPYHASWSDKKYIIARWGDELRDMKELSKIAREKYIIQNKSRLTKKMVEAKSELELLEVSADEMFLI